MTTPANAAPTVTRKIIILVECCPITPAGRRVEAEHNLDREVPHREIPGAQIAKTRFDHAFLDIDRTAVSDLLEVCVRPFV